MEEIKFDGKLYAMILRADENIEGMNFYTPNEYPLQLCTQRRTSPVQPHFHKKIDRTTSTTQEVIYMLGGKMKIIFYNESKQVCGESMVGKGDLIMFCYGGHGMEMVEEAVFFEVKNGPYISVEEDKQKL